MGGGGGSDSGSGGYDAAPMQYQQKQSRRKREERALGGASGGSYVTSGGSKPSIARSSSGSGVLTSKGVQRKEAFQTQEYLESTSGTASARQTLREGAAMTLQKRMEKSINPLTRASLQKQIADLKAGRADPVKRISESGKFVTVGTQSITSGGSPVQSLFGDNLADEDGVAMAGDSGDGIVGESGEGTLMTPDSKRKRTRFQRMRGDKIKPGILVSSGKNS